MQMDLARAGDGQRAACPFPGPRPYSAADRGRFFGRDALIDELARQISVCRSTTLFGPSGAGKSSLMRAGVIPRLVEAHGFRVVRVDAWPPGEAPLSWLLRAIFADLTLGELAPADGELGALDEALRLAGPTSERPILFCLDQLEQLLSPDRAAADVEALLRGVDRLARAQAPGTRLALAIREDCLGRLRDRARAHRELLANDVRVGPLTAFEMASVACRAAAAGEPPQRWDEEQIRGLMLEARAPGEPASGAAEVQAAYAQIVCRALFQDRASEPSDAAAPASSAAPKTRRRAAIAIEADALSQRYLDATIDGLEVLASDARRLLEDHLVTADGGRALRTEPELLAIIPGERLAPILKALEGAAVVRVEARLGARYVEIGHDWLARRVFERRTQRDDAEQRRGREKEQAEIARRQRAEDVVRLAKERSKRRALAVAALFSIVIATCSVGLSVWAFRQKHQAEAARKEADKAKTDAEGRAIEALDGQIIAGFRELSGGGRLAWGTKLLLEVQRPASARGWVALASDALNSNMLELTMRGHTGGINAAVWSPNGERVATASADGTARVWNADGAGDAIVLRGHKGPVLCAAWSADGKRLITGSGDNTARVWSAETGELYATLEGHQGAVVAVAVRKDGERALTASRDGAARVWRLDGSHSVELKGHEGPLTMAVFHPDGERVVTTSDDKTARVWSVLGGEPLFVFKGHKAEVVFVALSPGGKRAVTTSRDKSAQIWSVAGDGKPVVLSGHEGSVDSAAWSFDGKRVITASTDRTARIWSEDGKGEVVVLAGHGLPVTSAAFRPDDRYVLTASRDKTARIWPVEGVNSIVLDGHEAALRSAAWSPDGARALTAASDDDARSLDRAARLWRPRHLEALPRPRRAAFSSAFVDAERDLVVSACAEARERAKEKATSKGASAPPAAEAAPEVEHFARLWRADGSGDPSVFRGHKGRVSSAALSPDASRVVTASFDRTARVWRADGSGEPVVLLGHKAAVIAAAFSPDGSRVATASDDKTALVHRADGAGAPARLEGHTDGLTSVAWSPDGARLVTGSKDHNALIWRADGAGPPVALQGHRGAVNAVAWSPDGARVATASDDGYVHIWSAATGTLVMQLNQESPALGVIFHPDSARVAVASAKGGVRVWKIDAVEEPITLRAPAPALAMGFLDGGKRLLVVTEDNTTRTFLLDVDALRRALAAANADCLPQAVRTTYLSEPPEEARSKVEACERAKGRTPILAEGP